MIADYIGGVMMRKKLVGIFLVVLFLFISVGWSIMFWQSKQSLPVQALDKKQLIRLHVLANSDSPSDQAVKLAVRDAVIDYLKPLFTNAADVNDARQIVMENQEQIIAIAKNILVAQGFDYDVHLQLGLFDFPIKSYGDVVLPSGRYEAVRILIGQGQGKNWWCVMFPPLCFIDPVNATAAMSKSNGEGQPEEPIEKEIKIKWKVAELWEKWQ
jgi:stage II sporulation protein R